MTISFGDERRGPIPDQAHSERLRAAQTARGIAHEVTLSGTHTTGTPLSISIPGVQQKKADERARFDWAHLDDYGRLPGEDGYTGRVVRKHRETDRSKRPR